MLRACGLEGTRGRGRAQRRGHQDKTAEQTIRIRRSDRMKRRRAEFVSPWIYLHRSASLALARDRRIRAQPCLFRVLSSARLHSQMLAPLGTFETLFRRSSRKSIDRYRYRRSRSRDRARDRARINREERQRRPEQARDTMELCHSSQCDALASLASCLEPRHASHRRTRRSCGSGRLPVSARARRNRHSLVRRPRANDSSKREAEVTGNDKTTVHCACTAAAKPSRPSVPSPPRSVRAGDEDQSKTK